MKDKKEDFLGPDLSYYTVTLKNITSNTIKHSKFNLDSELLEIKELFLETIQDLEPCKITDNTITYIISSTSKYTAKDLKLKLDYLFNLHKPDQYSELLDKISTFLSTSSTKVSMSIANKDNIFTVFLPAKYNRYYQFIVFNYL